MTIPDDHLGALLRAARRSVEEQVLDRLHAAGYPDLRVSHLAVLVWVGEEGTPQAEITERSGLTAQAVSQVLDDLVARGYLLRRPAEADRRARTIVWTARGRVAREVALRVVADLERAYAERLGERRYATMRRCLAEIGASRTDTGMFTAPGS
ncbi:MAG: MarR family winged helix-turn-helix transcriptional regulator [Thermoleophilia bacterium]